MKKNKSSIKYTDKKENINSLNLPDTYLLNMKNILNDEYDDFLNSYNHKYYKGISINTKKINKEELKNILNENLEEIPWSDSGLYIDADSKMSKNILYHTGVYYIQEPSAMAPVNFLDVKKGMKVLDMCASPGGKTFQISQKLSDTDLLISNDINRNRIPALIRNIEYHGLRNVMITNENQDNLSKNFFEFFDRILLDAPCSGEGMFRKDKKLISSYEQSLRESLPTQKDLLEKAADMLKAGGKLLYSTCTFNKWENENNILDFLRNHNEFELVDINKNFAMTSFDELKESARFFPHKSKSEGHFLCLMQKKFSRGDKLNISSQVGEKNMKEFFEKKYISKEKLPKEYLNFEKNFLNCEIEGNFFVENNSIYLEIFDKIPKTNIRISRNGLYLGDIKNGEFIISSALIRHLKSDNFKNTIKFNMNSENIIKYLKGETLILDDIKDGDYVICLENLPIGLARAKNSKIKNLYNKNWRMI